MGDLLFFAFFDFFTDLIILHGLLIYHVGRQSLLHHKGTDQASQQTILESPTRLRIDVGQ